MSNRPKYPNVFDVSRAYAVIMRLALALAILPGLGTGLLLIVIAGEGIALPGSQSWPELVQAHGQVQALGFVLLFIVAVGLQLFPRFLGVPLRHPERAMWGAWLVATSVVLRLIGQPLQPGLPRATVLACSAAALPIGALLAGSAFHGLTRRSVQPSTGPSASWRRFVAVAGLCLGGSLVLYVLGTAELIAGNLVVPQGLDEALIHLELFGFAAALSMGVATRIFGRFLLLKTKPSFERWVPILAEGWGLGVLGVSVGWMFETAWLGLMGSGIELVVLLSWLWLVALYEAPARESGTPYVTNPTRGWVRLAFFFLVAGVALNTALYAREVLSGLSASMTELSAARHALAQGYLLPLMLSMAGRLLPVLSAWTLKHRAAFELIIDVVFVGAFLRVVAEAAGGYAEPGSHVVALGGALGLAGFAAGAAWLWHSLSRLPKTS